MNPAQQMQRAFVWACELDVAARKPGNVSRASPGHGMDADLFVASAAAAAGPLCAAGRAVGERIEGAVRATLDVAGCNTNLGIALLCAPLAAAWERCGGRGGLDALRAALGEVLASLDVDDARAAYRAIAQANPGGLGTVPEHDVAQAPRITLREAMAIAAPRDRIAWQYVNGYGDVLDIGRPAFEAGASLAPAARAPALPDGGRQWTRAMQRAYLELLTTHPDSHIVRKHGDAVAQCVMAQAEPWRERARRGETLDGEPAFAAWDAALKQRAINPGTTADLGVASACVSALCGPGTQRGLRW